jgi:CRP-like cAMP-binding protein
VVRKDPQKLRDAAASAVARGKHPEALELYTELEQLEPTAAAWPKRIGETQRRLGHPEKAVAAFERAVDKYVADGLLVQAIAVCKLILQLAPQHPNIAKRLAVLASVKPSDLPAKPAESAPPPPPPPQAPPTSAVKPDAPRVTASPPPAPMTALHRETAPIQRLAKRVAAASEERPVMRAPLPPGAALDVMALAGSINDAVRLKRSDGSESGISVLPIEAFEQFDELEIVDPKRAALLSTPLFAQVPPEMLEQLISRMALVELAPGDTVFREGDAGDSMFVIGDGEVTVHAGDHELARLSAGAFFGEIALVTDLPRSATVRAISRVELLAIDREVMREAATDHPEIVSILLGCVRDRLVDRITRTSELFEPFTDGEKRQLAAKFEVIEVDEGVELIKQGERSDGLYVVMAGRVEVENHDLTKPMATLTTGDVFGEMSLLANHGSIASVRTITRVLALRMPAKQFQEVIMTYPQVLAYLGSVVTKRESQPGSDDFIDLHLDLL